MAPRLPAISLDRPCLLPPINVQSCPLIDSRGSLARPGPLERLPSLAQLRVFLGGIKGRAVAERRAGLLKC